MSASYPLKVLIAEDHEFTRTGLVYSLQQYAQFNIIGEAENGLQAISLAEDVLPDVILMDIGMPKMDGIGATQKIKSRFPDMKVVMLTSRQLCEEIYAALNVGADAYCMKDITTDRLVQVLDVVSEGAVWLDPEIAKIVARALPSQPWQAGAPPKPSLPRSSGSGLLTERETQVLQGIVSGLSNKELATAMCLSVHTIKVHVRNLIQKLAVDDRTQVAIKALRSGLVGTLSSEF